MIRFSNWIISPQREVIARQHDNLTGRLEVLGDLPEGWIWDMLVRVGHYRDVLSLTPCDGGVGIDLSAEMLCVGGSYTMQLRGTQGELVRHTNQVTVYIPASLSGDEWWPELPSEFSQAEQRVRQCVEQATQEANRAEDGADAAQKDAEAAKGAANQAQQSAVAAQEANKGSEAAANQAKQSADQAAQKAAAAKETAWVAQEAARLAGQSAAAAQAARDGSEAAASRAGQSADQAAQKADAAASSASDAKKAQQAVENMTASAETLAPDAQASVTKTTQDDVVNLKFGIPQGQPGQNGGYYQPSVSEDGQLAFNPSQEDMPAVPSAYIKGPPGQDAPQIDDSRVSSATPWSSRQIVDTLAPEFEASGAVVTCTPVPGYPLHVVSQIMPVQDGEGDPSPENVRPIKGWTEAKLFAGGDNIFNAVEMENGILNVSSDGKILVTSGTYGVYKEIPINGDISCLVFSGRYENGEPGRWRVAFADDEDNAVEFGYSYPISSGRFTTTKFLDASGTIVDRQVLLADFTGATKLYIMAVEGRMYIPTVALIVGSSFEDLNNQPYNPASKTITLPIGQTVYGGTLDWITGVLTVGWISHTFNAADSVSGNWQSTDTSMGAVIAITSPGATPVQTTGEIPNILCASLKTISYGNIFSGSNSDTAISRVWGGEANQFAIRLPLSLAETAADIKSWLIDNAIEVVYQIATPITIQLTPTEILALSGTNTIYADTGDTTVSGREDPLTVNQRLSERIAALEFNMNLLSDYQRGDMT